MSSQNKTNKENVKTAKKATSSKRDSNASKKRILDAGALLFAKYGFNGTTTKMIAQEANINEALIARYFGGKEGLFIAIIQIFVTTMKEQELPYPPQEIFKDELIEYVKTRIHLNDRKKRLGKIIISHALTDDVFRKRVIKEIPIQVDPHLKKRISLLIKNNKISKIHKAIDICEDIETYLHGIFIFNIVMFEEPKKQVLQKVKKFISKYVVGLTN